MRAIAADQIEPAERPLSGTVRVPGDKSISHRMALIASVARGRSVVTGFSDAGDCSSTLEVVRSLGATVERRDERVEIDGLGWDGLQQPGGPLDCGRSGTTMRLACGILAGARVEATLSGDPQLRSRPMERVAEPLRAMGARITTTNGRPPIQLGGGPLTGIEYELPVASAQVKSAVLLAGLQADGVTTVVEQVATRDHTERLLQWLGAPVGIEGTSTTRVSVRRCELDAFEATVPGDLSSAAPLFAAAAVVSGSTVTIEGLGINPTRTAFLQLLTRMGAEVQIEPDDRAGPEPTGTVTIRQAGLRGKEVPAEAVPGLIDELPLVGVLGALAEGTTTVRGAAELRVKESDRISVLVRGLRALGARAEELPDGFVVEGPATLTGTSVDGGGDHRLAMAFAVAALAADRPVAIAGLDSVVDSFPGFVETLHSLR